MATDQHHLINEVAVAGKTGEEGADAVTDDQSPCTRKPACQPIQNGGTILASPILNGGIEPPQMLRARTTDAAIVIDDGWNPGLGEENSEAFVVFGTNAGAGVNEGDHWSLVSQHFRPKHGFQAPHSELDERNLFSTNSTQHRILSHAHQLNTSNSGDNSEFNEEMRLIASKSFAGLGPTLIKRTLAWLNRRFVCDESLRPELEQASLRVLIGGIVLSYLAWYSLRYGTPSSTEIEVLIVASAFFFFAVLLTLSILQAKHSSVVRRFVGIVADNAVTSYCLFRMGEGGAVVLGVYLFVTFGNGFRYGRIYLHSSQILGLLGFSLVLLLSSFWSQHLAIGVGLLVAMMVLPFYVGVLAERINEARKRADDANLAKGRFLANVSHEMRTPLNGVIAMADVLRETTLTETQSEVVETLSTSAHLLLAQIEDVLDMAKIEAGRVQIEKRPFDLGALISTTLKIVIPQARYKGLEVKTSFSLEVTRAYSGDAHHLRQVLLNLMANAVKFTETGCVTLRVHAVGTTTPDTRIRFEVEDTGIGIPHAKQAEIFEAFAQADDSITRVYGGTGLGTTIAKHLVTLMQGEIGVQSSVGSGSTFWFEVPLTPADRVDSDCVELGNTKDRLSAASAFGTQRLGKIPRIRGAHVLVAEDNPTNQRVTELILESGGHKSTIVANGEMALNELEHGHYDVALFDLSMPIISGLEAMRVYRFTSKKPIPILILSANVTPSVILECEKSGAAEFVAKPIRASVLLEAIDRQLMQVDSFNPTIYQDRRNVERPTLTVVAIPVIDDKVLADLARLSDDPTFIDRLLVGFRSDAERLVAQMCSALKCGNFDALKDAAHALKGGAASVGALQVVALAQRLENADREKLRSESAAWEKEISRAVSCATDTLDKHRERSRSQRHSYQ